MKIDKIPNSNFKKQQVLIIGGGISGLATAALLAKDGFKVTVLEKNSFLGGRASVFSQDGFVFDKGPSWYMMPEVFDNYFSIFSKKTTDFYQLKRLKIHYKVFFDSKNTYTITNDSKINTKIFEKAEKGAAEKLKKYLKESKFIYETAMKDLVMLDYLSLFQLFKPQLLKHLFRLNLFINLHQYVSNIFSNKDLQKILEFTTVFLGGSPYNTPAFYSLVSHADFNLGIYYPMGGMQEIIKALVSLCREFGVTILTNHEVTRIMVNNGYVTNVKTDKKSFAVDLLVSSMDYRDFEVNLLPFKNQSYPKNIGLKKPSRLVLLLFIWVLTKSLRIQNIIISISIRVGKTILKRFLRIRIGLKIHLITFICLQKPIRA